MSTYLQQKKIIEKSLESAGIEDAASDAMLLLEYICGADRTFYLLHQNDEMPSEMEDRLYEAVKCRRERVPLQHITGRQEFCGCDFIVNKDVLIPRQETELLVRCAARIINGPEGRGRPGPEKQSVHACSGDAKASEHFADPQNEIAVLDLCTGSGCIAVSVARLCPGAKVTASDISRRALETAMENAKAAGADIEFVLSDLFERFAGGEGGNEAKINDGHKEADTSHKRKFDVVISNPPYIKSADIRGLMPEVRDHEPAMALDGGQDGLYFYREITRQAPLYLKRGGHLLFEVGFDEGEAVKDMMIKNGFKDVAITKDLAGLDRVVSGSLG